MKKINFLTIWDKNYFHTILYSVKQINKIYPDASCIIYDWGFTADQVKTLNKYSNVHIQNWKIKELKIVLKYTEISWVNLYLFFANKLNFLRNRKYYKLLKKEIMLANKVYCFQHYNEKFKENFVFLDGDAFIIDKLEINSIDADIGLTVRRRHELSFKKWKCRLVNSWVIFFLWGYKKNKIFLQEWIKEMYLNHEYLIEQSSISRILEKINKKIFYAKLDSVFLKRIKYKIKIKPLSCEIYNYNWIEELNEENIKNVKVLHFKWWRHTKTKFNDLIKWLWI